VGGRAGMWLSTLQQLSSWILSYETARQHYADTALYTDDFGASIVVDGLGLEFGEVSTALNSLSEFDTSWWSMGKFVAMQRQSRPFVHLDYDVYLWKRLPQQLESAPVFAQHPEEVEIGQPYYHPAVVESALQQLQGTWLPAEWEWYRRSGEPQIAPCCGIIGGSHLEFMHYYASQAMRFLSHPCNQIAFGALTDRHMHMVLVEQWFLGACIEYHRNGRQSLFEGVGVEYLFDCFMEAMNPERSTAAGYTHLIATAKQHAELARRLIARVQRDYPVPYQRAEKLAAELSLF
jgi:hypothetical protein